MQTKRLTLTVAAVLFAAAVASADPITVDQLLYQSDTVHDAADYALLGGEVEMTYDSSANELEITLKNTTAAGLIPGGDAAGLLLTGIGFVLPTGMSITGGDIFKHKNSIAINFTPPSGWDGDLSFEWGYDAPPDLMSGALSSLSDETLNAAVSSMTSQVTNRFAEPGSLGNPLGLNGPDFGLLSKYYSAADAGGQEAIQDTAKITLDLTGSYAGADGLLGFIESNHVVLTFGSPDAGQPIPEPGSIALLGAGILGLALYRRRRKQ